MAYEEMIIKSETGRCLLCHNAPCSKACAKGIDVASIIRSLSFENYTGAIGKLKENNDVCATCDAPCMKECTRNNIDSPVNIQEIFSKAADMNTYENEIRSKEDVDLSIDF